MPFTQRLGRLMETVRIWRHMWGDTSATPFSGSYWKFDGIDGFPRPASPGGPALWLAGSGPRALAYAGAALDGWLPYPPDPAGYRESRTVLDAAAIAAGRDHMRAVTAGLYVTVLPHDDPETGRQELDAYARAYYGHPLAILEKVQGFVTGTDEQCAERLRAYADAGARHIIIRIGALDPAPLLERLAALARQAQWN